MFPERIACLAAEIPEILHELGALDRVVGIQAFTSRPVEALKIPKVSGFKFGNITRITKQNPDLVILTSGVQRDLANKIGEKGITLLHLNPHRLNDMFHTIELIGNVIGKSEQAKSYISKLRYEVELVRQQGASLPSHPRVYFEEWMKPIIFGTGWVSDIIEIAGGVDVFREEAINGYKAIERTIEQNEVIAAKPDIILASWCGRPFNKAKFLSREGYETIPAVKTDDVYEIEGLILQCGPMLIDSLKKVHSLIRAYVEKENRKPDCL